MKSPLRIKYPKNTTGNQLKYKLMSEDQSNDYNGYLQRLTKLIPGEAISLYLTSKNMVPVEEASICEKYPWLPLFGLLVLLVVRIWGTRVKIEDTKNQTSITIEWGLVLISVVSYIIWIYAIGDCILGFWATRENFMVAIAVMLWTFLVPYFYKQD